MFGSLASTSTSTSRHLSRDPFAFLDSGKQYVTMIREVFPARYASSSKLSTASSSSSSSSSTYVGTPMSWDQHSDVSASSSDEDDEDELETPPASPQYSSVSLPKLDHRKPVLPLGLGFPFSLDEVSEDYDARGGVGPSSLDWISPSPPRSTLATVPTASLAKENPLTSPSLDETPPLIKSVVAAPPPLAPAPATTTSANLNPNPTRPTRRQEERLRGRSRSPRLLWRSDVERPSTMKLLDTYYDQSVVGGGRGRLPRLKPGMDRHQVREWSRLVENAGI